jgi:N6-adenosine-specific RNA methylase IME4
VSSIAAKDCVLFLWVTVPFLEHAFAVMKAWGFTYKSSYVWVKIGNPATGYWNKGAHELLLIGTRGHVPAPAPGTQWSSVIEAEKGAHSVKPGKALEMIESYYPNLPKIELHRRGLARAGWDAWRNEVG